MAKKILAVKWRQLGDTVLWSATLDALRQWQPEAEITLALPLAYSSLYTRDPRWQRVRGLIDGPSLKPMARELARMGFDWVLNFHASPRSRKFCEWVGGETRLIHHHDRRGLRFGSQRPIVNLGKPASAVERDLNVLRTLGWDGAAPSPRLEVPAAWGQRVSQSPQFPPAGKPLLILGAVASRPAKQWPLENFAALAEAVSERWTVVVPLPDPEALGPSTPVVKRLEAVARVVVTPSLEELAGWMAHARAFVGLDSGSKHLAAALGVRTLTLFGPESTGEWHCYPTDRHPFLQQVMACRDRDAETPAFAWCGEYRCPLSSHGCMTTLRPEAVAQALAGFDL